MKSMNFFGDITSKETTKPKKKVYSEDLKKKAVKLAYQLGVTKAAEELGISTSSIYSWKKTLASSALTKTFSPEPIQNKNGNLTFELEGKTYSLNVNSSEEREIIKAEVNSNSVAKYDWFKEGTGKEHWVLYNTEMYEIRSFCNIVYLHYIKNSNLTPTIPINATSCYKMFYNCESLTQLDLSNFNTSNVVNMSEMFAGCSKLIQLDLSNFDTKRVTNMAALFNNCQALDQLDISSFDTSQITDMGAMFAYCLSLKNLDLSNFNTRNVTTMSWMFEHCEKLTTIYISNKWSTDRVINSMNMFKECCSLSGFSPEKTDIKMAKHMEQEGYLTLKKQNNNITNLTKGIFRNKL